ncbi:MAG: hypothetical protein L0L39_01835 [Atopostipes suicloacalis]|nr:hypothetical protein [Atopostipes suicloacalis]MDN6730901.1 hypothetical protein [Atopostipes suicloacalis]
MKKIIFAVTALLALVAGSYSIYADSGGPKESKIENRREYKRNDSSRNFDSTHRFTKWQDMTESERQDWFEERHNNRFRNREDRIKNALDEGRITEEEAADLKEELAESKEYDKENEFSPRVYHQSNRGRRNKSSFNGHCAY